MRFFAINKRASRFFNTLGNLHKRAIASGSLANFCPGHLQKAIVNKKVLFCIPFMCQHQHIRAMN